MKDVNRACLALGLAALGCGGDETSTEAGGGSGGSGGTVSTGGSAGTSAAGTAGSGATPSSTGGLGGTDSAGGTGGAYVVPDLADVDLTLGGLNADIVVPDDCLSDVEPTIGCVNVVGDFGGEPFAGCDRYDPSSGAGSGTVNVQCRPPLPDGDPIDLAITVNLGLYNPPPQVFAFASPPEVDELTTVNVNRWSIGFSLARSVTDGNHAIEVRVAGISYLGPGIGDNPTSGFMRGSFALVATPTGTCAPDAEGHGCELIRARGYFSARPVYLWQP